MPIGLTVPFARSTGSLGLLAYTDDQVEAAKQNLRSLLITNWGERPMHFHFGCNLVEFVFAQQRDDILRGKITDRIVQQVQTWLPYLLIKEVTVLFHEDDLSVPDNGAGVRLVFSLVSKPANLASLFTIVPGP